MCCVILGTRTSKVGLAKDPYLQCLCIAGESALADLGGEIQSIDLVGVMEIDVRFPLFHWRDFNRTTGVAFMNGRASSR